MAGEVPIGTGTVAGSVVMGTAHDGPVFHRPGKTGQMFSDANSRDGGRDFLKSAADIGGRIRLEIKGVQMTDASPAKKHDTGFGFAESVIPTSSIGAQGQ